MAAPVGGMYYHGDPSPKGATVVRTRTLPAEAKGNLGSMPVLVNHASSLSPAEPRGPLIPTNVRPPQCPTISALGGAFIPTAMTGSPFFHAAPSAPFCRSPKNDAPTMANFQNLQCPPWALSSAPLGPPMFPFAPQNCNALSATLGNQQNRTPQPATHNSVFEGCTQGSGARLRESEGNEPLNVISVPHEQAELFNKAALDLQMQLKAMGCFTHSNPTALALSKQLLESRRQVEEFAKRPAQQATTVGEAAARILRAKEEASASIFLAVENIKEDPCAQEEARRRLDSLSLSDLMCVPGPSPQEVRERRELQKQQSQFEIEEARGSPPQSSPQLSHQHQQEEDYQRQQEEGVFKEASESDDVSQKAAEEPQLRQQLREQEARVLSLQRELMAYQQREAVTAAQLDCRNAQVFASPSTASSASQEFRAPASRMPQRKASLAVSTDSGDSREERLLNSDGIAPSSRGLSTQSGSDVGKKTIDEALAIFLERRSLDGNTFRRVRSGVYFHGRTKLLVKFDNQGRLVCLPQHQGLGLLVRQQKYIPLEKFLLQQRRAENASSQA